jgi:aspartyl-tRNA(Asn)/glutamyl-tRNA(Gln) amidotransferase subunit C
MSFSEADVAHVATLARLGLSEEEKQQYGGQLGAILEHISMLQRIDTSDLPATARVGDEINALRVDMSRQSLPAEAALGGAPGREGDYFKVGAIQE